MEFNCVFGMHLMVDIYTWLCSICFVVLYGTS